MWTAAATPLLLGAACIVAFVRVQRAARRKLLLRAANVSKRRRAKKQKRKQQPRSRRDDSEAFHFIPIGHVRSCFPGCRGVPRQGALAPLTRAQLVLTPEVQPCALDGINEWSHIWITFVFHKNRKTGKTSSTGRRSIKYKIEPPKHTKKVGIFATRSPHRVNPIGQTIARVAKVTGRTLELRGVDLVDGTPVLDIKPYVPAYESIPGATMVCYHIACSLHACFVSHLKRSFENVLWFVMLQAPWVANAYDAPRLDVQISDSAAKQLEVNIAFVVCSDVGSTMLTLRLTLF